MQYSKPEVENQVSRGLHQETTNKRERSKEVTIDYIKQRYEHVDYIGDSVYVASNRHEMIMFTCNDGIAHNVIILEPEVVESLKKFIERIMS